MSKTDSQRVNSIRLLLLEHVARRLAAALSKIEGSDSASENERQKKRDYFHLPTLLASGSEYAAQIQMATHVAKATHPDLPVKLATNLNISPSLLPVLNVVGSHLLQFDYEVDATGNGSHNKKIYEIFLLLRTEFQGVSVLNLLKNNDQDAINALGGSPEETQKWTKNLSDLGAPRSHHVASHSMAKQVYWPVGKDQHKGLDPHDDTDFHLLSPLYASSLTHRVYKTVRDFSEQMKSARNAKKAGQFSDHPVHDYPQLAIQKLGGTKPHNISHLNSERRGENILLASLPPVWRAFELKPLLGTDSIFPRFGRRTEVRLIVKAFVNFLKTSPLANIQTRNRRNNFLNDLIDDFFQFSAELRSLEPGWSQTTGCHLSSAEKHWLDPVGVEQACAESGLPLPTETADRVSSLFANWLNAQLRDPLPMDDATFLEWRNQMQEQIKMEEREGRHVN